MSLCGHRRKSPQTALEARPRESDTDARRQLRTDHARLIAANGNAGNQVILIFPREKNLDETILNLVADPNPETSLMARRERDPVEQMDRWLDNVAADGAPGTLADKVVRDRPWDVSDTCGATDGEKITDTPVNSAAGRCSRMYPQYAECELKPVSPADYSDPLTTDQLQRLRAAFPSGVCDYGRPGVGQQIAKATWQAY
jgi:Tannase-like family of unknown function (DUF6351)